MEASLLDLSGRHAEPVPPVIDVHLGGFGKHRRRNLNARVPRRQPDDYMSRSLHGWPMFVLVKFHCALLRRDGGSNNRARQVHYSTALPASSRWIYFPADYWVLYHGTIVMK